MKKLVSMFAAIVAAFSFNSCDNESIFEQPEQSSDVIVNISVASLEPDTKAIKTNWSNGDKINIWFGSTKITNAPQLVLTYDGTKWTASELSSETINSLQASDGKLRAVYESTNSLFAGSISAGLHRTLSSSRFGSEEVCYAPMCCLSNDVSYTFSSNTLTASINSWVFETNAQVVIAGLDPLQASNYALEVKYVATDSRPAYLWDTAGWFDDTAQRTELTNSAVSISGGMSNEDGVAFRFWRMQRLNDLTGDILFTLIHKDASGNIDFTKTFTKNNTAITQWPTNKCTGIKINYSKFIHPNLLPGEFSVGATKKVKFTKGNLWCNPNTSPVTYAFETNQYDYPTQADYKSDWTQTSHVGHFYWTKTAAASYAKSYNDGTETKNDIFWLDGSDAEHKLTVAGTSDLYVMSDAEVIYLFETRTNASNLYKSNVTVAGKEHCIIIAPDNYSGTIADSYTAEAWTTAEDAGLVCLPQAGQRNDDTIDTLNDLSNYWVATAGGSFSKWWLARCISWHKDNGFMYAGSNALGMRNYAGCLRLVKTVE